MTISNTDFKNMVINAIHAFEKQGCKSTSAKAACAYYGGQGIYCIVGHMLPDDATRRLADSFDVSDIDSLHHHDFQWTKQFSHQQIIFLQNLQILHDEIVDVVADTSLFGVNFSTAVSSMKIEANVFFNETIFEEGA